MDDFSLKRQHLARLTDDEMKARFWELAHQVVAPMVELARTHTSPSIERSVVLRMGFSSLEAKEIVEQCSERGLLGKGAGGLIYRVAKAHGMSIREAGLAMARGELWETVTGGGSSATSR